MTIKTYDGADLIKHRLEQTYSKYPSGSLSPREVLLTLPTDGDDNALAFKINVAITTAIFKSAEAFLKANPPTQKKSGLSFTSLSDVKVKVDDRAQRAAELTSSVIKAVSL
jgi:hypothetical protein